MTTDITIASVLVTGLTVLSGVVTVLWKRLEKYQANIEVKLDETNKQLLECERSKYELISRAIKKESELKQLEG
jgi:hypothetical protein